MIALDNGDKIRGDASAATVVDYTLHGIDNNAIKQMADGQLAAAIGDLYTADSVDAVSSIILVNTDSSARTVNLYITPSGGSARRLIPKNMSLGIGYCLITDGKRISVYDASGNLLSTATAAAHDLGGSSHNADTLSNLNSKISDATLVDTDSIVLKALFAANSILMAVSDNDPAPLSVAASRILGRKSSGDIAAMTVAELLTLIGVAAGADVTGNNAPQAHKTSHTDGTDDIQTSSPTQKGIVELAIDSEINAGASTSLAVSPDGLAGSIFGKKVMYIKVLANDTDLATGDGKAYITIPIELNGMNLVLAHAVVYTKSTSGLPNITLERSTDQSAWNDMLSTAITIDANEWSSYTAATPPVINGSYDDVATGNWIRVNVDTAGTGTKGLDVILTFQLP